MENALIKIDQGNLEDLIEALSNGESAANFIWCLKNGTATNI